MICVLSIENVSGSRVYSSGVPTRNFVPALRVRHKRLKAIPISSPQQQSSLFPAGTQLVFKNMLRKSFLFSGSVRFCHSKPALTSWRGFIRATQHSISWHDTPYKHPTKRHPPNYTSDKFAKYLESVFLLLPLHPSYRSPLAQFLPTYFQ